MSISTAGRNRYLLHFNSHESLVEWTAAIRLAIYEHNTLQEAYTGALIAGKGKSLNNINVILDRTKEEVGNWVRVRFGAGQQWKRCWCVIQPPDEKEFLKQQKELKKRSPYDRSAAPALKGKILFYDQKRDGKKQKKVAPLATINDAYSAYAIYPQAKALIDASTLLKVEGNITLHLSSEPQINMEGFVFVMPEVNPMVNGFEMLLRFLFPTWDTFGLFGRPGKLVASLLDSRSLMFAMPKNKRYGYLEPSDVIALINERDSSTWSEQEWRRRLKEATGTRMNAIEDGTRTPHSRSNSRGSGQVSFGLPEGASRPRVGFAPDARSRGMSDPNSLPPSDNSSPANTPEFGGMKSSARPTSAYHSPEMRRANSRLSQTTLAQIASGAKAPGGQPLMEMRGMEDGARTGPSVQPPPPSANPMGGASANDNRLPQALRPGQDPRMPPPLNIPQATSDPSMASSSPSSRSGPPSAGPRNPYQQGGGTPSPGPQGRGGPPMNMRSPPPGAGPPPGMYGGRGRGGPPGGGRGGYGPPGPGGPPGQRPAFPDRSASLNKHMSTTADDIIDSYASDGVRTGPGTGPGPGPPGPGFRRPPPGAGPPGGRGGYGGPPPRGYPGGPPPDGGQYGGPGPGPGPGPGYGGRGGYGPPPGGMGPPGPMGPPGAPYSQPPRPYSPSGPRPGTAGRNSPAPQGMGGPPPWQQQQRTASPGPGGPRYGDARPPPSPGMQGPPGGGFSRPMGGGAPPSPMGPPSPMQQFPPQGQFQGQGPPQGQQYAPQGMAPPGQYPPRNAPQYQGQAF